MTQRATDVGTRAQAAGKDLTPPGDTLHHGA